MSRPGLVLRTEDGMEQPLDLDLWLSEPTGADEQLLSRVVGPVLDVGCGPGRHVGALAQRGIVAMGVDASAGAVDIALSRGVPVLRRSVFDPLPGTGRWGSVLIVDGSIGIGGDPGELLSRGAQLLRPGGRALIEVDPPGSGSRSFVARLESRNICSSWFPWASLSVDGIEEAVAGSGMELTETWTGDRRWFARLTKP